MVKFDVNLSILFTELPLRQRPEAARAAGFDAVEFWWPFDVAVPADRDVDAFVRAVRDGTSVACTGEDGRWSVAMCLQARASLAAGRPVPFAEG